MFNRFGWNWLYSAEPDALVDALASLEKMNNQQLQDYVGAVAEKYETATQQPLFAELLSLCTVLSNECWAISLTHNADQDKLLHGIAKRIMDRVDYASVLQKLSHLSNFLSVVMAKSNEAKDAQAAYIKKNHQVIAQVSSVRDKKSGAEEANLTLLMAELDRQCQFDVKQMLSADELLPKCEKMLKVMGDLYTSIKMLQSLPYEAKNFFQWLRMVAMQLQMRDEQFQTNVVSTTKLILDTVPDIDDTNENKATVLLSTLFADFQKTAMNIVNNSDESDVVLLLNKKQDAHHTLRYLGLTLKAALSEFGENVPETLKVALQSYRLDELENPYPHFSAIDPEPKQAGALKP